MSGLHPGGRGPFTGERSGVMTELMAAEVARAGRLAQLLGDLATVATLAWLAYLLPGPTTEAALGRVAS